jgi:hypothetical protein
MSVICMNVGGSGIHSTDNTCGKKTSCVTRQAQIREDAGRVVQDGVNTGPLLEEHGPEK